MYFSDVLLNTVDMKNSFHTNYMNVTFPLYELSGAASGMKLSQCFAALITCVEFLSSVNVHVMIKMC